LEIWNLEMWKSGKTDAEIEKLLNRYRPSGPRRELWDQISTFTHSKSSKSARTWPWAVAAAALLMITLGLHGAAAPAPDASPASDIQRVEAIVEELGRTPGSEVIAEWLARREARAEQDALAARATAVEIVRQ
jgi:hypothetical protein